MTKKEHSEIIHVHKIPKWKEFEILLLLVPSFLFVLSLALYILLANGSEVKAVKVEGAHDENTILNSGNRL